MKALVVVLAVTTLSSCSMSVKEGQRDRDSKYRGFWSATYLETPSRYRSVSVHRQCWDMAGNGSVEVAGGRVVAGVHGYDLAGFVDSEGKVTAELSLKESMKFILTAQLDASTGTGTGKLIHTSERDGQQGCNSTVKLTKSPV